MSMHDKMLTYGLKRGTTDELLFIDAPQVLNGLDCDCVCPHCKHDLIARNGGSKKTHHFAHASGADCGGARMTALHMLAQKILERDKKVMLPNYEGKHYQESAEDVEFDEIHLEQTYTIQGKQFRPDCVGIKYDKNNNPHPLWIEIYVTHDVDTEKQNAIREAANACIEIDISDMLDTDYTEESIKQRLQNRKDDRKWICCPKCDKLEEQGRLEEERALCERRRLKEEERQRELARIKEEREHEEYLKELSNMWFSGANQVVVNDIIKEIKSNPYPKDSANEKCIYNYLVPISGWAKVYSRFPRNNYGLQVFNCLIHYYYNEIKLDDKYHSNWKYINTPMWKLLNKSERTDEDNVLLEYMIVLWAINLLNNHKRYKDSKSDLAKIFSKNTNIRKGLMKILLQGGDRNLYFEDGVREQIRKDFEGKEDGETIIQVFRVCFPVNTKKSVEQSQQESPKASERRLYGYDKELAKYNVTEPEAWAELNRLFNEQESQRENNE